jgi:hypothetical protein
MSLAQLEKKTDLILNEGMLPPTPAVGPITFRKTISTNKNMLHPSCFTFNRTSVRAAVTEQHS